MVEIVMGLILNLTLCKYAKWNGLEGGFSSFYKYLEVVGRDLRKVNAY